MVRLIGAMLLAAIPVLPAYGELLPAPEAADPRIRNVRYSGDDVVEVVGHVGYTTTVFFEPSETVLSVALGDDVWQVAPEGNRISIKPRTDRDLESAAGISEADTNMTVFTDRRTYFFELRTSRKRDPSAMTFAIRFRYSGRADSRETDRTAHLRQLGAGALSTGSRRTLAAVQGEVRRGLTAFAVDYRDTRGRYWGYSWQGDASLRPIRAFDDGRFTYLKFGDRTPLPAVFFAEADGQETIANYHVQGSWIVLHRVTSKIVLRDGENVGCVFRERDAGG